MRALKGGLTNQSPSVNHSNQSSDSTPTLPHYQKSDSDVIWVKYRAVSLQS